jgi:succinate dehydrogenase/fumarate reductase cytochrome b subunit
MAENRAAINSKRGGYMIYIYAALILIGILVGGIGGIVLIVMGLDKLQEIENKYEYKHRRNHKFKEFIDAKAGPIIAAIIFLGALFVLLTVGYMSILDKLR